MTLLSGCDVLFVLVLSLGYVRDFCVAELVRLELSDIVVSESVDGEKSGDCASQDA